MKATKEILTDKQKECVNFTTNRDLLVQGVAGSGKSLVIINRAMQLYDKISLTGKTAGIAVFTYANSLVNYTREILALMGMSSMMTSIGLTFVFVAAIYGSYFLITYFCSRSIIKG